MTIMRCAEEGKWKEVQSGKESKTSIACSIGRLPIGRGMRPRRSYKAPLSQKIAIHKRNVVIVSDEENTSEYSHSPSSQHSTLESNTDVPEALKQTKHQQKQQNANNSFSEPDSSDSSEEEEAASEAVAKSSTSSVRPSSVMPHAGAIRSSDIISIPTFEADGAVNMV